MYAICNVKFTGFCSERCLVRCRAKQGKKMTDCQPTHNNTSSVEGSCHSSEDDLKVQKNRYINKACLEVECKRSAAEPQCLYRTSHAFLHAEAGGGCSLFALTETHLIYVMTFRAK